VYQAWWDTPTQRLPANFIIFAILFIAHVDDNPGITEMRGFRYVTAGIVFLVVITAIALTIFYVRKAQEEKSKKRFF